MNSETIQIENLKCGGCANTIKNNLQKLNNNYQLAIDIDRSEVNVSSPESIDRSQIVSVLANLGYPEIGTGNTFQKVKSYVSCAVGKMSS